MFFHFSYEKTRPQFKSNATTTALPSTTSRPVTETLKDDSSEMIPVSLTVVHAEV